MARQTGTSSNTELAVNSLAMLDFLRAAEPLSQLRWNR